MGIAGVCRIFGPEACQATQDQVGYAVKSVALDSAALRYDITGLPFLD